MERERWVNLVYDALEVLLTIAGHICAAALTLVGGFLLHHLVVDWLGDPKLYDMVPWTFVVDTCDLVMLATLVVMAAFSLWDLRKTPTA